MESAFVAPNTSNSSSAILGKIMLLQEEIGRINLHKLEHVTAGGEIKRLHQACEYCQALVTKEAKHDAPASAVLVVQEPANNQTTEDAIAGNSMATPMLNELERTVELAGKRGQVLVPRNWAGKRVKIVLLGS
jgi:hypothetical protein